MPDAPGSPNRPAGGRVSLTGVRTSFDGIDILHGIDLEVRKGETLGRLAKRYGTSVKSIQQANGLRGTVIQAKRTYKIPRRGGPAPINEPIEVPERVLPPPPTKS